MIALLETLVGAAVSMGNFVAFGVETAVGAILVAIVAAYTAAVALLPHMDPAPVLSGDWLGWINWFFPVGAMLDILTGLLGLWLAFLAVRYVLRLVRAM